MKKFQFLFLSLAVLLFASCEKDSSSSTGDSSPISADSELANLLLRVSKTSVSMKSSDDDFSKPRCFKVKLPATFKFSESEFIVNDDLDYQKINEAIKNFLKEREMTKFVFPMTLIVDGNEVVVNNADELKEAIKKCKEYDDDDAIDQVKINYPITLSLIENGEIKEIKINNDEELKAFLKSLKKQNLIKIGFPMTLKNLKGETITVNNNDELRDLIKNSIKGEIENIKDQIKNQLTAVVISSGSFETTFEGKTYKLTFSPDGTVTVVDPDGKSTKGTWKISIDGNKTTFKLSFEGETLVIFNQDFIVKKCDFIKLFLDGKNKKGEPILVIFDKNK